MIWLLIYLVIGCIYLIFFYKNTKSKHESLKIIIFWLIDLFTISKTGWNTAKRKSVLLKENKAESSIADFNQCREVILEAMMVSILQCIKHSKDKSNKWEIYYQQLYKAYQAILDYPDDKLIVFVATNKTREYIESHLNNPNINDRSLINFSDHLLNEIYIPRVEPFIQRIVYMSNLEDVNPQNIVASSKYFHNFEPDMNRLKDDIDTFIQNSKSG